MAEDKNYHLLLLKEEMIEDPEFAKIIYDVMKKLKKQLYKPKILVDSIFQRWERFEVTELEAFFFLKIYIGIVSGKIGVVQIEMNQEPKKNNMIIENNNILSSLTYPFYSEFYPTNGRGYNDDGFFKWNTNIKFGIQFHSDKGRVDKTILISPNIVPLEIGYTEAITTYFHLFERNGVARYPYNDTKIIILYNNGFDSHNDNIKTLNKILEL